MEAAENLRLREILELVVSYAIVREANITPGERWQAIAFLKHAGKMCSDNRQEFILLSDILGISMLVDAVDHVGGPGLSESTVLGPFYAGQQRQLAAGESILLREEDGDRRISFWTGMNISRQRCGIRGQAISHHSSEAAGRHQHSRI
jgi:hypothetical protein